MSQPRSAAARIAAAAGALVATAALAACGADVEPQTTAPVAAAPPTLTVAPPAATTPAPAPRKPRLRPPLAFHVRQRALLRRRPHGKPVTVITPRTEFKSPRIYAVVRHRRGWVQVRTAVRHHAVGWIRASAGVLFREPGHLVVDLSRHRLALHLRHHRTRHYPVATGAAGTPTPRGTFAVTDRLRVAAGSPYGCCVLALTAHQHHIAQGWGGGDRVAIHATPATWTIGKSISHGCLRASDRTLRSLFRHVRLGMLVKIHG